MKNILIETFARNRLFKNKQRLRHSRMLLAGIQRIFSTRSHWARIVPDNPVAFPPSLAVIPAQKHTGMTRFVKAYREFLYIDDMAEACCYLMHHYDDDLNQC